MKFENIKSGIKIEHKETGRVFFVGKKSINGSAFLLDDFYILPNGKISGAVTVNTSNLFRKHKEQEK